MTSWPGMTGLPRPRLAPKAGANPGHPAEASAPSVYCFSMTPVFVAPLSVSIAYIFVPLATIAKSQW